jgi:heat shock protein 4
MAVIGIDFGNENAVVAQAKRGGIDIVLNENSNRKNANLVCFQGKQRMIGEAAVSVARMNFKNAIRNVKLFLGRKYNDPEVQKELENCPFKTVELPSGDVGVVVSYNDEETTFTCEQIVGMILNKYNQIASAANENTKIGYNVLSCPGYYNEAQRRALLNGAKIGGLNVLRLLNEHAAVALAYGIYKSARNLFSDEPLYTMFIDMGNTAYTVSVVAFVQGKLEVKSVEYDRFLGGRDFDMAIANYANEEFQAKYKLDALSSAKPRMKLLAAAEKAKKTLSPQGVSMANINVEFLMEERDYNGKITLEKFEELVAPLLARLEAPITRALEAAGIKKTELKAVEIVGGGTRVASVKRTLANFLDLDLEAPNMGLSTTMNADESVARGCALSCAMLSPLFQVKAFTVVDAVTYPVRVSWEPTEDNTMNDDEDETPAENDMLIFPKFDGFEKTKRITLRRKEAFSVKAAYDASAEKELPSGSDLELGEYTISGIPAVALEDGNVPKVRVNVREDMNGMFSVSSSQVMVEIKEEPKEEGEEAKEGEEKKSDEPAKKRFKKVDLRVEANVPGMTEKEVQGLIEKELNMAQQDRIIEETSDKRNELESYIYEARNQLLDKFAPFVSGDFKEKFDNKLNELEDWLYSDEGFDSTKSVYQSKLDEALAFGRPIEKRFIEAENRPASTSSLLNAIEQMKKTANESQTAEKFSHWTDEDRDVIRKAASDAEKWLSDKLDLQNNLNQYDDPAVTCAEINDKADEMRNTCRPILNKPKPAPKVEAPPAPAADETKEGEAKEEGENMDLD